MADVSRPHACPEWTQQQFVDLLRGRNPEANLPAAIAPKIQLYRALVRGNLSGLLESAFPVAFDLLPTEIWWQLIDDFLCEHRAQSPLFREVSHEFLTFLTANPQYLPPTKPWLLELLHYEWVELDLYLQADEAPATVAFDPTLTLALSPLCRVLIYQYPVHCIGPQHQPQVTPETPTCLCVYRQMDDRVQFLVLNPLAARLLLQLSTEPQSAEGVLSALSKTLARDDEQVFNEGLPLLADWYAAGMLVPVS